VYRADEMSDGHRIGDRLMNSAMGAVRDRYERRFTRSSEETAAAAALMR